MVNVWAREPLRKYALRMMFDGGLRSREVPKVAKSDFESEETEDGETIWRVRVNDAKTGSRTTVVPGDLADLAFTIATTFDESMPICDVTSRTIQHWVEWAADEVGGYAPPEEEPDPDRKDAAYWERPDFRWFSAHDARRTWATHLVHSGVPESVVMSWGGWEDYSTFSNHYYGEETPERTVEYLRRSGLQ